MRIAPLRLAVLTVLTCLGLMPAFGQLAPVTTFDTLEWKTVDSDLVVRGRVTSVDRADKETVSFHVEETLKGPRQRDIKFGVLTGTPPPKSDGWDSKEPMLVFLVESRRLASIGARSGFARFLGRYRYTPRWDGGDREPANASRYELVSGTKASPYASSGQRLTEPEAILARVRAAAALARDGPYVAQKIDLPKGYHLIVPTRGPPRTTWGEDPPARFGSSAAYDGARILAAKGKDACLWDAATGKLLRRFEGVGGDVGAVALSPDSQKVVVGSNAVATSWVGSVIEWDVATGKAGGQFGRPRGAVRRLDYVNGEYQLLATCNTYGSTGPIQGLWNTFSQEPLFVYPGRGLTYSAGRDMAAAYTGDFDPESWVGVWDSETHLQLCTIDGADRQFHSVRFSPYGNRVVTSSSKGVEIWEAETGKMVSSLTAVHAWAALYAPDGESVLAAMPDASVTMWEAASGKVVRRFKCPDKPHELVLSLDGNRLLVRWGPGFYDDPAGSASLFDVDSGKELMRIDAGALGLVGFSPDGRTICAIGPSAGGRQATIWDAETGKVLRTVALG